MTKAQQTIRVFHMVLALVAELGLDKELRQAPSMAQKNNGLAPSSKPRTLAERRLFLGAYWVGSMLVNSQSERLSHRMTLIHKL